MLTTPDHEQLKALAAAGLSRKLYHHCPGFAHGEWKDCLKPDMGSNNKRLLHLNRVLMTGLVLINEGAVEADLHKPYTRIGWPRPRCRR